MKLRTNKPEFSNEPVSLTRETYLRCCDIVVNEAKQNKDVESVYLMGADWQLGVSDLDIIIVYANSKPDKLVSSPWGLSSETKNIFTHGYLSFESEVFKYFYYFYPKEVAQIRLLWGKEQAIIDPLIGLSDNEKQILVASQLFDVLVNKLMLFPRYLAVKSINTRKLIGELYSLKYTAFMVENMSGIKIGQDFLPKIAHLREHWLEQDLNQNHIILLDLLNEGIKLVSDTIEILDNFVCSNIAPSAKKETYFRNKKFRIKFSNSWKKEDLISNFLNMSIDWQISVIKKRVEIFGLVLPFSLYSLMPGDVTMHDKALIRARNSALASGGSFKVPFSYGFRMAPASLLSRITDKIIELFI